MRLIYEAANTVEAHMIVHLLEQAGLSARIDGEYLQGGVGELQALGIIRVMVAEEDYADAKIIIQEWDARQPPHEGQESAPKKCCGFGFGIIGLIMGIAGTAIYYHTPVTDDGIDYDGDGGLDERWTYVNYIISKTEVDRNFDGKVDLISSFDRRGIIESSLVDQDLDGTFETEAYYHNGNIVREKTDTIGDGFKDLHVSYKYGVCETATFIDAVSKKPIKIQHYGPFGLQRAEVDTTGDGILDTKYTYDHIEEISQKTSR